MFKKKEKEIKIVNDYPPKKIYKKAQKLFGKAFVDFDKGVVFAIDHTIYCRKMTDDLYVHESTHVEQQERVGWKKWWKMFFKDEKFRYNQELEAYRKQYKYIKENIKDRNTQVKYLNFFAQVLSSPLYGSIITFEETKKQIRNNKQ